MKIKKSIIYYVEYDDTDYIRLGQDNWMYRIGESLETIYECEQLEKEFQETLRIQKDIGMI